MAKAKKQRIVLKGNLKDDSIIIGSHGDAKVQIEGTFDLSGIIYCPKYTVTLSIKGDGKIAFRGKCNTLIIKTMKGGCTLDLSELTCKELRCESLGGQALVIAGKTRIITRANLADEAELRLGENPLITSSMVLDRSRIVYRLLRNADLLQ